MKRLANNITHKTFNEINLEDSFFDSLREDYLGFDEWFKRKIRMHLYNIKMEK